MLAAGPSGERFVLVDTRVLPAGWRGWDASPGGHVLAALDVARRADGHDVLLPVLHEPLSLFLRRRADSAVPLRVGEAVTIGVSLLRARAELAERASVTGEWWLAESGRPVFATDASPTPFAETTTSLFDEIARAVPRDDAWNEAVSAAGAVRVSASDLDRAEMALFATAVPEPLDLRAPDTDALGGRPARGDSTVDQADTPRRGMWESLMAHVDGDLADLVSKATTGLWRRWRSRETGRRRRAPVVVAASAAAGVLAVGLLWPADSGPVATAEGLSASPTPSVDGAPGTGDRPQPTPTGQAPEAEDLEAVTGDLLDRLAACGDDHACAGALFLGDRSDVTGIAALPSAHRELALLDDFGGVAVLRVDAQEDSLPPQLVVIAAVDGEWLLRDVHDATQQP